MGKMIRITLVKPGELVIDQTGIPNPGKDEILLKVERCGVCGSDPTIYRGLHPYAKKQLIMGHEFSGTIEELGENVKHLKKGIRVTAIPHVVCGKCKPCQTETYNFCEELKCMGAEADGAHVNYVCVDAKMVLPIPDTMTMDDAAMVEPACVAYHGAKRGEIKSGDIALVVGAGPIGIFAMQSCKVLGAKKVIIADLDEWRLNLAKKLGADGTINVRKETLEQGLTRLFGNAKDVDVFYDCVGEKGKAFDEILKIARRGTRIVIIGVLQNEYCIPHLPDFVQHELRISGTTMYVPQDYKEMIDLMGKGKISTKGMITHYFKISEIKEVFKMIDSRKEPFFKIMLTYD
ncbi:MAG: alcohol dehydrogenase catalytic domain-containing protein [Lentimicrobiaceae bacterium]|nr:alcohol dehydrogenase catalytic domain-containing protein [Lentimicrobiaceae bacterium]